MGASRKLQGEIDRVLIKVQEGVDAFDSIWNKVYETDKANQKERFEADLRKEIKKLQRYRDQIKTWIQSSEIKDKKVGPSYEQAIVDARKQIEREMDRFKIYGKESKMKAFSKEGLEQEPKTDPEDKAKSETREWLNNVVGELESQIDSFEAEVEGMAAKKRKTIRRRLTHLETLITRHKAHIMKLELILRLLDNDELSPERVNDVKDFLDDYVERNQDDFDEFSDVDELYSSLPLDNCLEDKVTTSKAPATFSQDSNSDIARTPPWKSSAINSSAAETPSGSHGTPAPLNLSPHTLSGASTPSIVLPEEGDITSFPGRRPSPSPTGTEVRGIGRGGLSSQASSSMAPSISGMANRNILPQTAKASDGSASGDSSNPKSTGLPDRVYSPSRWRPRSSFQNQNEPFRGRTEIEPDMKEKYLQRLEQMHQEGLSNLLSIAGGNFKQFNSQRPSLSIQPGLGLGGQASGLNSVTAYSLQQQKNSIHQQPDDSSSEAVPTSDDMNNGGLHDQLYNLQMLEVAYYRIPQPEDSQRAPSYIPKHPVATPASYPQVQAPIVYNPAFWERLSTDTMFFAFYYQQNTYQQYLAARELKKQLWRYHTKYNAWFLRHGFPKIVTNEFEQGTFVFFDFHTENEDQYGWCQRIKTEFTFDFNYLEDEFSV